MSERKSVPPALEAGKRKDSQFLLSPPIASRAQILRADECPIQLAIINAVSQGTLRIFIIDQQGLAVIDKRNGWIPVKMSGPLLEKLSPRIGPSPSPKLQGFC